MSIFEKGFWTILGCDLLMVLVALPLALRKVPRNPVYGFRTRSTLSDDAVWYAANAHFGRGLVLACVAAAAAAFLLRFWAGLDPETFLKVSVAVLAAPPLLAGIATARLLRRLSRGRGSKPL